MAQLNFLSPTDQPIQLQRRRDAESAAAANRKRFDPDKIKIKRANQVESSSIDNRQIPLPPFLPIN